MTSWRGAVRARVLTFGLVLLPATAIAQSGAPKPAPAPAKALPPSAGRKWTAVDCVTCKTAGISLEFSRLPAHGPTDAFVVARVRNLTQKEVAGSLEVRDAELPDAEGFTTVLWFVLSPLGSEKGEQLVLLPSPTPVVAVAHGVGEW